IGFAGARVSAGTIASELPEGFQRSEFLFRHGFVDRVVHRSELRAEVATLLRFLEPVIFEEAGVEAATVPAFRPLSFLSSLANRGPRSEPRRLGAPSARPQPQAPAHPRARRRDGGRVHRAAWGPAVRRRRSFGRRPGAHRRPANGRHRPAEGRRNRREHPAELRDAAPGGVSQGHSPDGARGAIPPAGRHVRRRPWGEPGPGVGAHTDPIETARRLKIAILAEIDRLARLPLDELVARRYRRYRDLGAYTTVTAAPVAAPERPGLVDRLRDLLEAGLQTIGGPTPGAGRRDDDDPQ